MKAGGLTDVDLRTLLRQRKAKPLAGIKRTKVRTADSRGCWFWDVHGQFFGAGLVLRWIQMMNSVLHDLAAPHWANSHVQQQSLLYEPCSPGQKWAKKAGVYDREVKREVGWEDQVRDLRTDWGGRRKEAEKRGRQERRWTISTGM